MCPPTPPAWARTHGHRTGHQTGIYHRSDRCGQLERTLYIIRKKIEKRVRHTDFYIVSLSAKNIIYKGMLSSMQVREYFPDLTQPYFTSGLALVHSRFSTNTFPT